MVKIKRALISVSDKSGLDEFVRGLNEFGVEILSTGGTAKRIKELGIPVTAVGDFTGFPEMLDGRVKTLHPKIHAGLLARRDEPGHMAQMKKHGLELIDMVVVNLYPFEKTVRNPDVSLEEAIENIDIGGPSMLRSAAKNSRAVAVICDPGRYEAVLREMKENNGALSEKTCFALSAEVFERTAAYDRAIAEFLRARADKGKTAGEDFPEQLTLRFVKAQSLRYGENPHQQAAFYREEPVPLLSVAGARQLHGKELSFNNILDLDAALNIALDFSRPAAVIIKHNNPCGAAAAPDLKQAYVDALACDPLSAFGGIVGFNGAVDAEVAREIAGSDFIECVIAPGYDAGALAVLRQKKNLRIMEAPAGALAGDQSRKERDIKRVRGGVLIQDTDRAMVQKEALKCVTKKKPADKELDALLFAWKAAKHVKSNAIVLAQETKTVGIGAGQMSRVDSVIIAVRKAAGRARGAVLASDAFFPKEDAIEQIAGAGIAAVIQPGGSIRDAQIIEAADKAGIAMVFTGMRHFKH